MFLRRNAASTLILALAAAGLNQPAAAAGPSAAATVATATSAPAAVSVSATHPRILLNDQATTTRLKKALKGGSDAASRFRDMVDNQMSRGDVYGFSPWYAAMLYSLTNDNDYAQYAIEATDKFVAGEEEKISRSERASVAGDSYLEVGPVIGNVALVYDWCYAKLTPQQRTRWIAYSNQAVANVWNHQAARWGDKTYPWSGWSVDNPSNNYYYSFLRATMLLGLATSGENPEATRWLQLFEAKIDKELLPTFNRDLQGGGSREGTGYGTAMKNLWQLYDWWERSTGQSIATRTPHTLASMAHLMHSIVPTLDRLAPTGDHSRESTAALFDYHREYLLELQALFPNERLSGISRTLLQASSVPRMAQGFEYFHDFMYELPDLKARPLSELYPVYWGPGTGQLMMRSSWEKSAAFANFICGPYTESHAHRDQGSFVIYKGAWLAADSNMYSHSGIEQDESLHNLVRFEADAKPIRQQADTTCSLAALADTPRYTYASSRSTPQYAYSGAITKSEREFVFIKPSTFVVFDRASVSKPETKRIWTLNLGGKPKIDGDTLRYADGRSKLDVFRLAPATATTEVNEWKGSREGMNGGVRVDVAESAGTASTFLHVLAADGAVMSAARSDTAGKTGAIIKFADGRVATVRFSTEGTGGDLELTGADQSTQTSGPLPVGVKVPPLFAD